MDTTKTNTITHLSLCTGYEGIGKGLRRVLPNVREIAYVEIEAFAIANLVAKMETQQLDPAPIYTNLKTFPYKDFLGKVSILSGGFPCQPFSLSGVRKATEDPRHLFPYIAEGIRECQPRIVFLENVEGIISAKTTDGESVLRYVLRTLEGLGYRATAGIFSASEVGFPHQRKRVYILGYSEGTRQSSSDDRSRQAQLGGTSSRDAQSELSNTDIERLEGSVLKGEPREQTKESSPKCSWGKYPARPNEEQYEWEAPRVVEAKPRLGGATNGSSNRVDRLRLLGNGVVPQTA
ncbi:MAG: DNA (cytosine-5-)-methyltransferase, partial [Candidatus Poseidoniales archaeon]